MKPTIAALSALLLGWSPALAAGPVSTFHSLFYGEGGGYQQPSPEASECLENCGIAEIKPQAPPPKAPPAAPPAPKEPSPQDSAPVIPKIPDHRARPAPPTGKYYAPARDQDPRSYSLWEGLVKPLEMPSEKVGQASPDQANLAGRRDYETHVLGAKRGPEAGESGSAPRVMEALAAPQAVRDPKTGGGEVFVALDLKSRPKQYRDAVADLARAVSFRQDPRFAPAASDPALEKVEVWGWLPAGKLGEAMRLPSVLRLEVARSVPRTLASAGVAGSVLLGIRIPASASPGETLDRVVRELSSQAGFRWKKTIGYQRVPHSSELALVVLGEAPVKSLSRIMAHPDVLKVLPVSGRDSAPERPGRASVRGFFSFVLSRYPLLLALTLLVLLSSLGSGLRRLAAAFIPYH